MKPPETRSEDQCFVPPGLGFEPSILPQFGTEIVSRVSYGRSETDGGSIERVEKAAVKSRQQ
jgi:hypothetical protein